MGYYYDSDSSSDEYGAIYGAMNCIGSVVTDRVRIACIGCYETYDSDWYSSNQWRKGAGNARCMNCVGSTVRARTTITCIGCHHDYDSDEYSSNQWRKGAGRARCMNCVESRVAANTNRHRACCGCGKHLDRSEYSKSQWAKAVGESRCTLCVKECVEKDSSGFGAVRSNLKTTRISVDRSSVYAQGAFRVCYLGRYTGGQRTGQRLVAKFFKRKFQRFAASFFESDLAAVAKASEIVTQWNQACISSWMIRLNSPAKWEEGGKECFVEPFIEGFEKFNSNTGWMKTGSDAHALLNALSHYSYHISSGHYVLCDLQGGVYRDGIILTDPVVLSRQRKFGPTDLGEKGISSFFYHHRCNRFCQSHWNKPYASRMYFSATRGSTFM